MKINFGFALVLFSLFLISCGGGDDPAAPEPGNPPLASGTVGSEGGELVDAEVVLTVPAGALDEDAVLSIFSEDETDPISGEGPVFRIEGLPEVLNQPIILRLRHDGAKADQPLVFLAEERESFEGGRGETWFDVATRDSAGWAIAELARGPYVLDGEKAAPSLKVTTATDLGRSPTSSGHYEIIYDPQRVSAGQVALIAAHFEQAWTAVTELGFNFGGADIWPRQVYLRDIPIYGRLAQYTVAPYGKGHFTLDPDAMVNSVIMGIIIGHEVLHSAQDHFDTRPPSTWKTLNIKRLWLDEATSSWFEEKFYSGDDQVPLGLDDHLYLAPLHMFAGQKGTSWAEMGYGLSQLIKYVVDSQGEGRILELYERFTEVGDGTVAFLEVVDPTMDTWIDDFFHQWATGNIYPYHEPGTPIPGIDNGFDLIAGQSDSFHPPWRVWPMGASLSYFTISDGRDDPLPRLKIVPEPGGPLRVSLYGMNAGQAAVRIATAADSLVVDNLPDLCREYEQFMAMGVRNAEFIEGEAEKEDRDPAIAFAEDNLARFESIDIFFKHKATYNDGVINYERFLDIGVTVGRVSDFVYHAEWDSLALNGQAHHRGYCTIELDPVTMDIISFSAEDNDYYPRTNQSFTQQISGTAVPNQPSLNINEFKWRADGAAACGCLTYMDYFRLTDGVMDFGVASYECLEDSYLVILLRDRY